MVKKLGRKMRWESYERKKKTRRKKDGVFVDGKKRWKFFFVDGNFLSLTHCAQNVTTFQFEIIFNQNAGGKDHILTALIVLGNLDNIKGIPKQ